MAGNLILKTNQTSQTAERNEDHATDTMTLPLVNDLDTSWRDGVLLCLLVDVLCSGGTTNVQTFNSTRPLRNCRLALHLANKNLQLPPVRSRLYHLWTRNIGVGDGGQGRAVPLKWGKNIFRAIIK